MIRFILCVYLYQATAAPRAIAYHDEIPIIYALKGMNGSTTQIKSQHAKNKTGAGFSDG